MSHQLIESLFDIFGDDNSSSSVEDAAVSEHAWQGGCFALAELARRGKISKDLIGQTLDCVLRVNIISSSLDIKHAIERLTHYL